MRQFVLIATFLFLGIAAFAQERAISGIVTDAQKAGIPGVSVLVKGTSIGTVTDLDGKYQIKVPANASTLVFSSIEFKPKEVQIGEKSIINVDMSESVIQLEEFVVTGLTSQKKSDVTGAVSKISSEEIQKVPVSSIDKALQGQGSGVQVTSNSGKPGGDVMIRIRGVGTFGDAKPLFIVDGVAMDDIGGINPRDVASMEILKDGSSTAIYGARGANGVVIITTKKGEAAKDGRPSITYETYFGFQTPWKTLDVCNATEWATLNNAANFNTIAPGASTHNELLFSDSLLGTLGEGTNWQKELFRTAMTSSHQFSLAGGTEKHQYMLSGSSLKQDGIVKGSDYEKYIIRLSNTNQLSKRLKQSITLNMYNAGGNVVREQDEWTGTIMAAVIAPPYYPIRNIDGSFFPDTITTTPNPVKQVALNNNHWKGLNFFGSHEIQYNIIKGLNFKNILATEQAYYESYEFSPTYQLVTFNKDFTSTDDPEERTTTSELKRSQTRINNFMFENILTYTKKYNKHNVLLLVGQSGELKKYPKIELRNTGFPNNEKENQWLSMASGQNPSATEYLAAPTSLLGYLARVEYSFNDRYLLTANVRRDGSSKFPKESRWGTFPSATLGWKLSEEAFIKKYSWINLLKIRAGYGIVGNQNIDQSSVVPQVDLKHNNYIFGTNATETNGNTIYGFPDPTIKWERILSSNVGLNASLFKNQIEFTFDYFVKQTKDMLVQKPIARYIGASDRWVNLGTLENKGFEAEVRIRTQIKKKVDLRITPNVTHIINNVTYIGDDSLARIATNQVRGSEYISYTMVGYPVASFYGYTTDGTFQTQEEIDSYTNSLGEKIQPAARVGDRKYVDTDKDGRVTIADKSIIGNPWPKYFFGMGLGATYKNWDLDILLQGQYGNKIFNAMTYYLESSNAEVNVLKTVYNNYTNPQSDSAQFLDMTKTDKNTPSNYAPSDWYLEDGSFLRFRNIQITYTLPESALNKLKISGCQFYIKAQNLITITKYSGFDPEIGEAGDWLGGSLAVGTDRANYPQARTFMGGMIISF